MAANIAQHHGFHDELDALGNYATEVMAGKAKYDGAKIVTLVDGFGENLARHLNDEIPTILNMRQFGEEKMGPVVRTFEDEAEEVIVSLCVPPLLRVPFFPLSFPLSAMKV